MLSTVQLVWWGGCSQRGLFGWWWTRPCPSPPPKNMIFSGLWRPLVPQNHPDTSRNNGKRPPARPASLSAHNSRSAKSPLGGTRTHIYIHTRTPPRPPLRSVMAPTRPHFPFWVQPKPFRKAYNILNLAASAPQHAPTACWVMSSRSLHSPPTRKGARPEYQKRAGKFDPRS